MRGKMIAGAAVAGIAGLLPAVSHAAPLTITIRISGQTGDVAGTASKSKSVTVGQVVSMDVFAILQDGDSDPTNDGILSTHGSYTSSNGGILGNFRGDAPTSANSKVNNPSPFNGAVAAAGRLSDLDGDGDLDLGSFVQDSTLNPLPWFVAVTGSNDYEVGDGSTTLATLKIGTLRFTVTGAGASTSITYVPRIKTDGTPASSRTNNFEIDGVQYLVDGNGNGFSNGTTPVVGAIGQAAPVVLTMVPEPVSLGLLGIGAAALLRRRKA